MHTRDFDFRLSSPHYTLHINEGPKQRNVENFVVLTRKANRSAGTKDQLELFVLEDMSIYRVILFFLRGCECQRLPRQNPYPIFPSVSAGREAGVQTSRHLCDSLFVHGRGKVPRCLSRVVQVVHQRRRGGHGSQQC